MIKQVCTHISVQTNEGNMKGEAIYQMPHQKAHLIDYVFDDELPEMSFCLANKGVVKNISQRESIPSKLYHVQNSSSPLK